MNSHDIFVRNLKNLMIRNKIKTNKDLADKIGISNPSLSCIMNGDTMPSLKTVFSICEFFDVSMDDLFMPDAKQYGESICKKTNNENADAIIEHLRRKADELHHENIKLKRDLEVYKSVADQVDNRVKLAVNDKGMLLRLNVSEIEVQNTEFKVRGINTKGQYIIDLTVCVDDIINEF